MSARAYLVVVTVAVLTAAAATAHAGSYQREELVVDGVTRELFVYTPAKLAPGRNPVVLAFHGFMSDAAGLRWIAKIDRFADAAGFIVIYPNAVAKSWNAGRGSGSTNRTTDDEGFARALLAATAARPEVDPDRIYAMGFSNGAQMVATIVCKLDNRLAAAAMVAHSLNIPGCEPRARVPMLLIQGRKDPFVPFDGGGKSELASHQVTVDFFRRSNGAGGTPVKVLQRDSISCTASYDAAGREQVLACTGERDGHTWPGGVPFQPEVFGPTNAELTGTKYVFAFFARHTEPAPRRTAQPATVARAGAKPPTPATASAAKAVDPGRWTEHQITLGNGRTRRYFEPRQGLADARLLVLIFPDDASQPDAVAGALGTARWPANLGYVIVDAELAAALDRVVDEVRALAGADLPISVIGVGAGGAVAQQLYCDRSDLVSAVVLIAAGFKGQPCSPRPVPSLMSVQSAADPRAPANGDAKRALLSQAALRASWKAEVGVVLEEDLAAGAGYACLTARQRRDRLEVLTCRADATKPAAPIPLLTDFLARHRGKPEPFTIIHAR